MATLNLTIPVPDALVVPLGKALAAALSLPEPTTNAERVANAEAFFKREVKRTYRDYKMLMAAQVARDDDTDGSVSW